MQHGWIARETMKRDRREKEEEGNADCQTIRRYVALAMIP